MTASDVAVVSSIGTNAERNFPETTEMTSAIETNKGGAFMRRAWIGHSPLGAIVHGLMFYNISQVGQTYSMRITYHVTDAYKFDPNLFPTLHKLLLEGKAKVFETVGVIVIPDSWLRGERLSPETYNLPLRLGVIISMKRTGKRAKGKMTILR
jgi:hypothetical protein